MMFRFASHSMHRRAISTPALVILLVLGVALLALTYVAGRMKANSESSASEGQPAMTDEEDLLAGIDLDFVLDDDSDWSPTSGMSAGRSIRPMVSVEPGLIDLGLVPPHQTRTAKFWVQNHEKHTVTITSIRPSCQCTGARVSSRMIPPGEAVELVATFKSGSTFGTQRAVVNLALGEFPGQLVHAVLMAEVGQSIITEPPFISAHAGRYGVMTLRAADERPFRVLSTTGAESGMIRVHPETGEPRTEIEINWSLEEFDPVTCVNEQGERMPRWVVIETDHPDSPVLDIMVRDRCAMPAAPQRGLPWTLRQPRAFAGLMHPGEPTEVAVQVQQREHLGLGEQVERAVSESGDFTARLLSLEPLHDRPGQVLCRILITPTHDARGVILGALRLESDNHHETIMVTGAVRVRQESHVRVPAE